MLDGWVEGSQRKKNDLFKFIVFKLKLESLAFASRTVLYLKAYLFRTISRVSHKIKELGFINRKLI